MEFNHSPDISPACCIKHTKNTLQIILRFYYYYLKFDKANSKISELIRELGDEREKYQRLKDNQTMVRKTFPVCYQILLVLKYLT